MTNNAFTLALTSGALDDLNKTVLWYDKKVSGLGERFLLKSRLSIANIRQFPQAYSFYKKDQLYAEPQFMAFLTSFILPLSKIMSKF